MEVHDVAEAGPGQEPPIVHDTGEIIGHSVEYLFSAFVRQHVFSWMLSSGFCDSIVDVRSHSFQFLSSRFMAFSSSVKWIKLKAFTRIETIYGYWF